MNKIKTQIVGLLMIFAILGFQTGIGYAQSDCKVLMPQISGTYKGKCKKGLAHGNGEAQGEDHYVGHFTRGWPDGIGTYTYANGDVYKGDFIHGMRDGEGTLTLNSIKSDSVMSGLWKDDKYLGPIPEKPKVIMMYNLDKYDFQYISNAQNRVLINFMQNGKPNGTIQNLSIVSSSGGNVQRGLMYGVDYITFPVDIKVNYTTWNKLQTQQYYVTFEFRISRPGDWVVTLYN